MIENIEERLTDYLFAEDIYAAYAQYKNKIQETIKDYKRLDRVLRATKRFMVEDLLKCSAVPNMIDCMGIGLYLYYNNLGLATVSVLLGEIFRDCARGSSRKNLEFLNRVNDSNLIQISPKPRATP